MRSYEPSVGHGDSSLCVWTLGALGAVIASLASCLARVKFKLTVAFHSSGAIECFSNPILGA